MPTNGSLHKLDEASWMLAFHQAHSDAGCTACRVAYRLIMLLYAVFIGLWVPLNLWMMPWHTLRVGQVPPENAQMV